MRELWTLFSVYPLVCNPALSLLYIFYVAGFLIRHNVDLRTLTLCIILVIHKFYLWHKRSNYVLEAFRLSFIRLLPITPYLNNCFRGTHWFIRSGGTLSLLFIANTLVKVYFIIISLRKEARKSIIILKKVLKACKSKC